MCNKLWFLTQDDFILDAFEDEDIAVQMELFHKEEQPQKRFFIHTINSKDLAKFPAEFNVARDRGLLHD